MDKPDEPVYMLDSGSSPGMTRCEGMEFIPSTTCMMGLGQLSYIIVARALPDNRGTDELRFASPHTASCSN